MNRPALIVSLCCLAACGGGDSPVDRRVGEGRIVRQIGPGGGVLRGDGGTALQGFVLEIPAGALTRLVDITLEPAADIATPESSPASAAFSLRVFPDPGVLLVPATLKIGLDLPSSRRPEDLFVASRPPVERPSVLDASTARRGVLADFGSYDPQAMVFTAPIRSLTDLQVRLASRRRLTEDAFRLVQHGYESLARLSDAGLDEADVLFAEAQRADPFLGAPHLFRAISRVMTVLNDRDDTGPGLDSVGEALGRLGVDVTSLSLIGRLRTGIWPGAWQVPPGAPAVGEVLELLRVRLRPALLLALADLDRVPATTALSLTLPEVFADLPGERELDAADLLALRATLTAAAFVLDHLGDYDLEIDLALARPRGGPAMNFQQLLGAFPGLGRLLRAPDPGTDRALRALVMQADEAFHALVGEDDEQGDDLLTFPVAWTADDRDRLRINLAAVRASIEDDVERRLNFDAGRGTVAIRIGGPWRAGAISPRDLLPDLFRFLPVAGTLPDPTAAGLFPTMTQDRATDLLGFVDLHATPRLPIVADGSFADWTPAAEALTPPDRIGDVLSASLTSVDLWQVWHAESEDLLAFRLGLADGAIAHLPSREARYGFRIRDVGAEGFGAEMTIAVVPTAAGFEVQVIRDGVLREVRGQVAVRGAELELTVDRFDLLDPDEAPADRAIEAFAQVLDLEGGASATDTSRPFLVRF